jgi:hypothetical protein
LELYGTRQISLPSLILMLLGVFVLAGAIIHAMGHPLVCKCGYIKIWHGGIDDPEVSQHFIDWYTYSHVIHGIMIYCLISAIAQDRLSIALGLLIAVSFAAAWEILENAPLIVERYARTTIVREYAGDAVVNSAGDILATMVGFLAAARLSVWLTLILFFAALLLPHDHLLILW